MKIYNWATLDNPLGLYQHYEDIPQCQRHFIEMQYVITVLGVTILIMKVRRKWFKTVGTLKCSLV